MLVGKYNHNQYAGICKDYILAKFTATHKNSNKLKRYIPQILTQSFTFTPWI